MKFSRHRTLTLLAFSGLFFPTYAFFNLSTKDLQITILASVFISYVGNLLTHYLIPRVAISTLKAGLHGLDINKKGTGAGKRLIPESLGLAVGVVFLICLICTQQFHYYEAKYNSGHSMGDCTNESISAADYNAALATICFMLFLGFADDVLDIRWRVKLMLPAIATLPLLTAYTGGTGISLPKPLHGVFGLPAFLELGIFYKIYMVLLTIFCTNSINILAGVNGLEAGQTFIISCAILLHNLCELSNPLLSIQVRNGHVFSAYLMLPLSATTFSLITFNWYPAKYFVGDTFTYFAGMTIAVAGILGHFSETLLIFFIPQIFNFVYSLPQLLNIVPCPRHRLPKYDIEKRKLFPTPNWNLVNLTLYIFGPCTEEQLCIRILILQYICCAIGFILRWSLKGWYK